MTHTVPSPVSPIPRICVSLPVTVQTAPLGEMNLSPGWISCASIRMIFGTSNSIVAVGVSVSLLPVLRFSISSSPWFPGVLNRLSLFQNLVRSWRDFQSCEFLEAQWPVELFLAALYVPCRQTAEVAVHAMQLFEG